MTHLLDTNFCIAYLRGQNASVLARFRSKAPADLAICATVRSELLYGALRSRDPVRELAAVQQFLAPMPSVPFDDQAAETAAGVRSQLAGLGTPIGPYDLQIAGTAIAHGLVLVTHNTREFARVPGLLVEDWQI